MTASRKHPSASRPPLRASRSPLGGKGGSSGENPAQVRRVFDAAAQRYNLMNDVMSLGIHRLWKADLAAEATRRQPQTLADVACGTGDVTRALLRRAPRNARIFGFDPNPHMLAQAAKTASRAAFVQARAEALPLPANTVDAYVIAYGMRNVANREQTLAEALRVLRPGGVFVCLEFSHADHPWLERLHAFHRETVIPRLGAAMGADTMPYRYMAASARRFPGPRAFAALLTQAGFVGARWRGLGAGVNALHTARAP